MVRKKTTAIVGITAMTKEEIVAVIGTIPTTETAAISGSSNGSF